VHIEYTTKVKSEWRRRRRKNNREGRSKKWAHKTSISSLSLPPFSTEVKVTTRSDDRNEEYKSWTKDLKLTSLSLSLSLLCVNHFKVTNNSNQEKKTRCWEKWKKLWGIVQRKV
jgi:hypothetical protein